jgi:NAD-dependent dihydropyrimidine dehydrogenase PreA subunit
MKTMQYLKNTVTLKLDTNLCNGCGMCAIVCPHAVFEIIRGKANITDIDDCMECGACARNCKTGAITVN